MKLPKKIKNLKPLRELLVGDIIFYKTCRGNIKQFLYGKQTWYGKDVPFRIFLYKRGKRYFRTPTMTEIYTWTFSDRSRMNKLRDAVYDEHPLWQALSKTVRIQDGGRTIFKPIEFKETK